MIKELTAAERKSLIEVSADIGVDPVQLYRLIAFESGWDPLAENPRSSAAGLIQFIDSTAQWLGFRDAATLIAQYPTIEKQLRGPVRDYLLRHAPYDTEQSLHMAVFYPAAREWPADQPFPEYVQSVNPGISTPADYMSMVYSTQTESDNEIRMAINASQPPNVAGRTIAVLLIAGAAVALWTLS